MSQKSPPKIVKVDLQPEMTKVEKKPRKKIQIPKTKYTSPQDVRKFQKTFSSSKKESKKQSPVSKLNQDQMIESDVKIFQSKQFSFSQQIKGDFHKIQGKGYEIKWKGQYENNNDLTHKLEKVGYVELNVGIKLFELCDKKFQYEALTIGDCAALGKNLAKCLKAMYGTKNSSLIMKKESEIVESVKLLFHRKRSLLLHQVIMYMVDCSIMDQLIQAMVDIFPNQIKSF